MTTIKEIETESRIAVVEQPTVVAATPVVELDLSGIPESPAELLEQWAPSKKPLIHSVIAATLVRWWDAISGPPMSDLDRSRREIAEHGSYAGHFRRHA